MAGVGRAPDEKCLVEKFNTEDHGVDFLPTEKNNSDVCVKSVNDIGVIDIIDHPQPLDRLLAPGRAHTKTNPWRVLSRCTGLVPWRASWRWIDTSRDQRSLWCA